MTNLIVTTNIVLPIFLVMAVGFIARRIGLIDEKTVSGCNRLVFRVFLPTSLARSIMRAEGSLGGALRLPVDESALHDGRHELLLVREPKHIYQAVSLLLCLARGKYDHPLIVCQSVSRAVFHMPEDMPWSLDGERADAGRTVVFENMPSAYRLMLPKN